GETFSNQTSGEKTFKATQLNLKAVSPVQPTPSVPSLPFLQPTLHIPAIHAMMVLLTAAAPSATLEELLLLMPSRSLFHPRTMQTPMMVSRLSH
ncbi:hypothetical protein FS837_006811, partial [Tulasnella sp. UAMH 9824]